MGIIFSRFRKKLSTKEQLEKIEQQLEYLEDYKWNTIKSQKHTIGLLFVVSGLLFIIIASIFYYYYFKRTVKWQEKCAFLFLLLLFPILVYGAKIALQWYYRWDIDSSEDKLRALKREKKKILEKVMETETYKVAKELLEKYDPSALKEKKSAEVPQITSGMLMEGSFQTSNLRYRASPMQSMTRISPNRSIYRTPLPDRRAIQAAPLTTLNISQPIRTPLPRLPRPVFPQNRGVIEKLVDYVVGDGPSNRYALICFNCKSHNGMALQDEFEYLAFRCCYCNAFNPARKERPSAPRILSIDSGRSSLAPVVDEPESDSETKAKLRDSNVNIVDVSHVESDAKDEKEEETKGKDEIEAVPTESFSEVETSENKQTDENCDSSSKDNEDKKLM